MTFISNVSNLFTVRKMTDVMCDFLCNQYFFFTHVLKLLHFLLYGKFNLSQNAVIVL